MGSTNRCPNFITCRLVAIPYPGRGHINPMINFCKLIANERLDFLITFIVTEEWLGFLGSEPHPFENIHFATIPNVIPSEKVRAKDFPGFIEAVGTKMEGPVEQLLDQLPPPKPKVIIFDSFMKWVLGVANRRAIPAASFWPMSATFFTVLYHLKALVQSGQWPAIPLEQGEHRLNGIPGFPSIRVADIPREILEGKYQKLAQDLNETTSLATMSEYLLFTTVYEMESQVIDSLKTALPCPIYNVGLAIPSFNTDQDRNDSKYISWSDAQPKASVLYISQGSFLSASGEQLDEIVAGVRDSGIRFFWVARENSVRYREGVGGDSSHGLIVPWCDQLKVLCHPCIGGFWSHCGWNSAKEAAFAGLPMLTSPIAWDQYTNSEQIVEYWKIGWRLKRDNGGSLVKREEIAGVLKRFMDLECEEGKEMRRRAQEISEICRTATSKGGSIELEIEAFIKDISKATCSLVPS